MKVLVIQTAFSGDVILTLPLIQSLARDEAIARVDVLCIPGTSHLLINHPDISEIISYDKRNDPSLKGLFQLQRNLRRNQYDIVISPHRSFRSAVLSYKTKANIRISFDRSAGGVLYTHRQMYGDGWHEIARNLSLLSPLNISPSSTTPRLYPGEKDYDNSGKILWREGITHEFVCLSPGSVWSTKRWTVEGYADLAMRILEDGYQVVLLGGNLDEEVCTRVCSMAGGKPANLAGKVSWLETAVIIKRARAIVSNDSAPVHVASAMGTPVVDIYGPTSPVFGFTPWQTRYRIVRLEGLPCAPCAIHGGRVCPIRSHDCMKRLPAEHVYANLVRLLEE